MTSDSIYLSSAHSAELSSSDLRRINTDLCGVVLAAGFGERLLPLTDFRPKALCPVNNEPLLDVAIQRVISVTDCVAVNICHHREQMLMHLAEVPSVHVIDEPVPSGTAGALASMASWIGGRDVIVHNVDSWHQAPIDAFVAGWDRRRIRMLVVRRGQPADFNHLLYIGVCLIPWSDIAHLPEGPSGLYEVLFRYAELENRVEFVEYGGAYFDCGTPRDYLEANLAASGGRTVVGPGARVDGMAVECVIWDNASVPSGEFLERAIRVADGVTVHVGPRPI